MNILGYKIDTDYPAFPVTKQTVINTINPHSYCVAKNDEDFQNALKLSDVLIPDGIGIVWAARILKGRKIDRIAGPDFHLQLLSELNEQGKRCFYLGSSGETLAKIEQRLGHEYPNIRVDTFSPPFKESFSDEDNRKMIKAVNAFNPDVLFVGLTAPKQEKWVYQHKSKLHANVICSIGAAFDFFAGTSERSSDFWKRLGLEWFPRFLKEPKRLWKRNFISTPKFIIEVLKYRFSS